MTPVRVAQEKKYKRCCGLKTNRRRGAHRSVRSGQLLVHEQCRFGLLERSIVGKSGTTCRSFLTGATKGMVELNDEPNISRVARIGFSHSVNVAG